jgi:hypothetical protein
MATVQDNGDLIRALRPGRGIAGSGPQVDVPEPSRHLVHRYTGLQAVGSPVGPERVRVREPLGYSRRCTASAHEPVLRRQRTAERVVRVRDGRA